MITNESCIARNAKQHHRCNVSIDRIHLTNLKYFIFDKKHKPNK